MESKLDKNNIAQVSLDKLSYPELSQKVWDDLVSNQSILNEAFSRVKNKEIEIHQFRNLMLKMGDIDSLNFPAKLLHDTPKIRQLLFEGLKRGFPGDGAFFWLGTLEGRNKNFLSLVQDLTKIDTNDITKFKHIQDRAISSLGKLLFDNDSAAKRVRNMASAFLDVPVINTESALKMRGQIEEIFVADTLKDNSDLNLRVQSSRV